jgi:hypothetical protein
MNELENSQLLEVEGASRTKEPPPHIPFELLSYFESNYPQSNSLQDNMGLRLIVRSSLR